MQGFWLPVGEVRIRVRVAYHIRCSVVEIREPVSAGVAFARSQVQLQINSVRVQDRG
jgi:hypothetical protein